MLDAGALIEKHRGKGVFVDANLLVLLLVGQLDRRHIQSFKRTQGFTVEDFHVLNRLIRWFGSPLVATPHVLSQVSDLIDLPGRDRIAVRQLFKSAIKVVEERHDFAVNLAEHKLFEQFGLADASVAAICGQKVVVLTADVQLQIALGASGLDAINFNHVRRMGWR